MKDQRPTRCPCSADSSRNAGPAPRSFRKAETGVSQSSTNVWRTGTRLWSAARARTSSSDGPAPRRSSRSTSAKATQHLLRRGGLELAAVEARPLARVARGARGLHEREQSVAVAVVADRPHLLDVARRGPLVLQLSAGAAPEVELPGRPRARERLGVRPRQREHLTRRPVLDHARHEAALV